MLYLMYYNKFKSHYTLRFIYKGGSKGGLCGDTLWVGAEDV